ncbi:MAG: FAD-binding protein, partial [Anaerolineales bacterium]|nr:FAD-binding protein [Anaerolineales bacterium]
MTKSNSALEILRPQFGNAVQENVSLAPYTSARIGGPADVLVTVKSKDELANAIELIWKNDLPYTILGGGSNVLV